jgi:hypothetical protein
MACSPKKPDLFASLTLDASTLADARYQLRQGAMEGYTPAQYESVRTVCGQAQGLLGEVGALAVVASITDSDLSELLGDAETAP